MKILRPTLESRRDGTHAATLVVEMESEGGRSPSGPVNSGIFGSLAIAQAWLRIKLGERWQAGETSIEIEGTQLLSVDAAMASLVPSEQRESASFRF